MTNKAKQLWDMMMTMMINIIDNTSFVRLIGHGMKRGLARGDLGSRSMKPVVQEEQRGGCLSPESEET